MTDTTLPPLQQERSSPDRPSQDRLAAAVFVLTVFASASLVFLVEPMVARLVLPLMGGSPAVWNTSLAFFQAALLIGYLYAHLLQRIPSVRTQTIVHVAALVIAGAAFFPLRINNLVGDPATAQPTLWLLGVLTLSLGAPFAVLSATAPLVQAWYAKVFQGEGAKEPYAPVSYTHLTLPTSDLV